MTTRVAHWALFFAVWAIAAWPASAEEAPRSSAEHRAARPDLFHQKTGLRIARQRAPTPSDIPGATRVGVPEVQALIQAGAVLIDVNAAARSAYDPLDGAWLVREPRRSLPGAVWLPETGRGTLTPEMARYFETELAAATGGDLDRPLVIFCIADCWMSWNAAQRAVALGYGDVRWFRDGTDGWLDAGLGLIEVAPRPVDVH